MDLREFEEILYKFDRFDKISKNFDKKMSRWLPNEK